MTSPDEQQEAALIRRSMDGDKGAFGQLVARYQRFAFGVAYHVIGEPAAAEDVAQEAFLKAWLRLDSYRGAGTFRAWLARIVVNAALDEVRRRPSEAALHELQPAGGESVAAGADRRECQLMV